MEYLVKATPSITRSLLWFSLTYLVTLDISSWGITFAATNRTLPDHGWLSSLSKGLPFSRISSVPTVKVRPESFYEIMKLDEEGKQVPVMRLPIATTIMQIEN